MFTVVHSYSGRTLMLKNEIATTVHHDGYEQYWHYWKDFQLGQSNYLAKTRMEGEF